jgi:hypothetical protein
MIRFPGTAFIECNGILQLRNGSLQPLRGLDAAAFDDRPHGPEWKHAATVLGNYDLLSGERMPPFLVATGGADPQEAVVAKNPHHLVRRSLGVPRSPNRHLEELSVFRQIDVSWHQVELCCLSDIRSGFGLGLPGRGAAGDLRADGGVIARLGIMFQNDPECHIHSILPSRQPLRPARLLHWSAWEHHWLKATIFARTDRAGLQHFPDRDFHGVW